MHAAALSVHQRKIAAANAVHTLLSMTHAWLTMHPIKLPLLACGQRAPARATLTCAASLSGV